MSRRTLELLDAVGLLDGKSMRPGRIAGLPDEELRGLLTYYRRCRIDTLEQEIAENAGHELGFCGLNSAVSTRASVEPLLPAALVYDRLFLDDPLFALCPVKDEQSEMTCRMMGMPAPSGIDREEVMKALAHISSLAPLIRDSVVCTLPVSLLHEPDQARRFVFSADGFRSSVPPHLYDYVHASARVRPVTQASDGCLVVTDQPLTPVRRIYIDFADDRHSKGMRIFALYPTEYSLKDSGTVQMGFCLDLDSPPPQAEFDAWVRQSINQTVGSRLEMVADEMALAHRLGASYITESGFEARLCGLADTHEKPAGPVDAVNFLHAIVDELRLDSPATVAVLRNECPVLFERFRRSLRSIARELQGADESFDEKAHRYFDAEIRPQIEDIRAAADRLAFAGAVGGMAFGLDIALAVISGDAVPFLGGLALTVGAGVVSAGQAVPDYLRRRRSPEYIWSRIARK